MAHSLWSGSISFGLINIPVLVYSAAKQRPLEFSMLRKKDLCPINYTRVCQQDGKEVPYEDIVKGYEVREGSFVVLDDEDFKRAEPEKSELIDIREFVEEPEIDSKYFEHPYYLEPGKGAEKAYLLLRESLEATKKVAVAQMVFRARQNVVVLKPEGKFLLLNQLRYQDEIRPPEGIKVPEKVNVAREEIEMAVKLIGQMRGKFNPEKYHDTYTEKLLKLIHDKAKGKRLKPVAATPRVTKPVDLASQLRASLHA